MDCMGDVVKKHGLVYSADMHTLVGIDSDSGEFSGRIPFGVHFIADGLFSCCPYQSVSLPDSVRTLTPCLFENSKKLEKVKLPRELESLPPYLFSGCTALTRISMPDSPCDFSEGLFSGCSSLAELPFRPGVKSLPDNVASGCTALRSLVIPEGIVSIGENAFSGCTSLESLVIPASIVKIDSTAFSGCTALRSIRISPENSAFYLNPEDGSLYSKSGHRCAVKVSLHVPASVSFFNPELDDEADIPDGEDFDEEDDTFSAEIGAADGELSALGDEDGNSSAPLSGGNELETVPVSENKLMENSKMEENSSVDVDSVFADIMNDEKTRNEQFSGDVAAGDKEVEILSEMMDVMNDEPPASHGAEVTADELEHLFAGSDSGSGNSAQPESDDSFMSTDDCLSVDGKTKILVDSAEVSRVMNFTPEGTPPSEPELFVIAENLAVTSDGTKTFSEKLVKCCESFASVQDLKRVILLYGLPLDNEEFNQFYYHFMGKKNVVLACAAGSPSQLSPYCRKICDASRISLGRSDMNEQRRKIGIKNDTLIKLVIQDKY